MILSILKFVVTLVVAIVSVAFHVVKLIARIISDGAAQAKDATPSVVEALKVEASITADRAVPMARKVEEDVRKMFKIPTRNKVEVDEVLIPEVVGASSSN